MAMATLSTPSTRSQYTYDQFIQQAQRDGLLSEFSDADLALAQRNPDAGMSILSYKRDYRNATTDADRELATWAPRASGAATAATRAATTAASITSSP